MIPNRKGYSLTPISVIVIRKMSIPMEIQKYARVTQ